MLFIDAERVPASLDYASLVDSLRRQHREDVEAVEDMMLQQPAPLGALTHFLARALEHGVVAPGFGPQIRLTKRGNRYATWPIF